MTYACWMLDSVAFVRCLQMVCGKSRKSVKRLVILIPLLVIEKGITRDLMFDAVFACALAYAFCRAAWCTPRKESLIKLLTFAVIFYSIKFVTCGLIDKFTDKSAITALWGSLLVFTFCLFLLPFFRPDRLSEMLLKGRGTTVMMTMCAIFLIFVLMTNENVRGESGDLIPAVVIPMILLFLWALSEGQFSERKVDEMKESIKTSRDLQKEYDKNIQELRIRQHSFQNHIAAMQAAAEMDEGIAREYRLQVMTENDCNHVLLAGNPILGGFVYAKMEEIRAKGCKTDCDLRSLRVLEMLPAHRMTEVIGILMDNAAEALEAQGEDGIFEIRIEGERLTIRNTVKCSVSHEEMSEWFQSGWSSKGANRGLGLYRLKELGRAYGYEIICGNTREDEKYFVEIGIDFGAST